MLARAGRAGYDDRPHCICRSRSKKRLDAGHFAIQGSGARGSGPTELAAARGADVVLFCVKTTDTESTARSLAPLLPSSATSSACKTVSTTRKKIRAGGIDALSAVVYVAASVPEPGRVKHVGRGDLVIGPRNDRSEKSPRFLREQESLAVFPKTSTASFGRNSFGIARSTQFPRWGARSMADCRERRRAQSRRGRSERSSCRCERGGHSASRRGNPAGRIGRRAQKSRRKWPARFPLPDKI